MQTEIAYAASDIFPITLNLQEVLDKKMTDDEFEKFCRHNPDLQIELTVKGELLIIPPTGGETGNRNFSLIGRFFVWVETDGSGIGFDSSTVFKLPNGAKRSPDVSWITNERWEKLTKKDKIKFPPLCPDFVVELRSATDALKNLQNKMAEYIENGARLGWLIDPLERRVHVYRPNEKVEILNNPGQVSGEPLLKKFVLKLEKIW